MIKDLWQILTTVANLTNEVKGYDRDIQQLQKDVNNLTLTVTQLKKDLENLQVTTSLRLENYKTEIDHTKESIAAKFDVLTTRLDLKIVDFESRLLANKRASKFTKSLKKPQQR